MNKHRIAIIAGDGIGKEVIPAGLSALRAAAKVCGFEIEAEDFPWGCDYYLETGRTMPAPISIPNAASLHSSSLFMAARPTSPAEMSPTQPPRSGLAR